MRRFLVALVVLGCGDDTTPAGPDASPDAPRVDAPAIDAAIDAAPDAEAPDAGCAPTWTIDQLAMNGEAPSIVFDAQGTMHVSFTTGYQGNIMYGHRPAGGAWTTETIAAAQATWSTAIAVDRNGGVHVAFQNTADAFRYGYKPLGGTWTTELVQSPTNIAADQVVSIALDSSDQPHLAFEYVPAQVTIAHAYRDTGGNWVIDNVESLGSAGSGGPRIAMSADVPHIAYPVVNANLRYATPASGGGWTIEQLSSHPENVSLALEAGGLPHLLYAGFNGSVIALLHSRRDSAGTWSTETAATANQAPATCGAGCFPAYANSIVLDAVGGIHTSYADNDRITSTTDQVLVRYAYRASGGAWTSEYIDGVGAYAGIFNAIALDPAGGVHVVYSRAATNTGSARLMHAYRCR